MERTKMGWSWSGDQRQFWGFNASKDAIRVSRFESFAMNRRHFLSHRFIFFQDIGHKKKLYENEEENGEVKRTTKKSYVLWSMIEKQNGNENA